MSVKTRFVLSGFRVNKLTCLRCEWLFVLYVSPVMSLSSVGFPSKKGSSPPVPTQLRVNECVSYSYVCNSDNLLHLLQEKENKRPNEGAEI